MPIYVYALEAGIEYDGVYIDYETFNYEEWNSIAKSHLELARNAKNDADRKKNYGLAAGAYQTMIKVYPADAEVMATLGHIYGKMNKPVHAKAFLDRGLNLELKNPLVNYYYGIFREDEKDYRKALKFYNFAYQYGMENDADLNMRLAIVNAKLGELEKSSFYYLKACELLKNNNLKDKIRQLDDLKK
ncbi:hypothetical protein IJ818_05830 [bacterium]|nr:hypothetical protein [bacterium]